MLVMGWVLSVLLGLGAVWRPEERVTTKLQGTLISLHFNLNSASARGHVAG